MTLGGFARGGMGFRPEGFKKDHVEAYGADTDFQFNLLQENDFNLWAGLGFSWAPNRNAYNKREDVDVGGATAYNIDRVQMQYGQLRLLLVPEWQATESLSLGVRLGVGLDWIRMRDRREGGLIIPGFGTFSDSGTEKFSRFGAEGIAGLQATYMFTDNFGLYANVDARMGEKVKFKKEGRRVAPA